MDKGNALSRRAFVTGAAIVGAVGLAGLTSCSPKTSGSAEGQQGAGAATPQATATYDTDLLIIGCGGSGLACAVQSSIDGTNCIVIEQGERAGGNANFVEGMFAINSSMQKELGIAEVSPADIIAKQMQALQYRPNGADWVDFCEKSADNIEWCLEQGVLYNGVVDNYYTGDEETMHWFKDGTGSSGYVPPMTKRIEDLGVDVRYNTIATQLVRNENGSVTGAYAENEEGTVLFNAKAVVLATGGFGGNPEVISQQGWNTENIICMGAAASGDGYKMAVEIGAKDDIGSSAQSILPSVAAFPTVDFVKDPYNPLNGLSGLATGGPIMWINEFSDRFVREDIITQLPPSSSTITSKANKVTYCLFDQNIFDTYYGTSDELDAMFSEALEVNGGDSLYAAETLDELAGLVDLDAAALKASVERYNASCAIGTDKDFLKTPEQLVPIEKAPFYIAKMSYTYFFSTGGLKVDKLQRVWDTNKNPIPGLYAIGNDGNAHYASLYTINIPGTAFGHQVNSGRVAAINARGYIDSL